MNCLTDMFRMFHNDHKYLETKQDESQESGTNRVSPTIMYMYYIYDVTWTNIIHVHVHAHAYTSSVHITGDVLKRITTDKY